MRSILIFIIFIQLALVTINVDKIEAAQYRHPATGLVFAETIAGISKGRVRNFEEKYPGLGVSIGYNAHRITVTLYVYNLGLKSIESDPSSPTLKNHFREVVQDIYGSEKAGHYRDVNKLSEGTISLRSGKTCPQALSASFGYIQDKRKRLSKLFLLGYKQHFVKIRFTYDEVVQAQAEETLTLFCDEFGKLFTKE